MNWTILEGFVETLFDMVNSGDMSVWEAKNRILAFLDDIRESYEIIEKNKKPLEVKK